MASLIGWKVDALRALAAEAHRRYAPYEKRKANGGFRRIAPPDERLKGAQRDLLSRLFPRILSARSSATNVDAVLNAGAHRVGAAIARLDLKDAFPSTTAAMVVGVLRRAGLQPVAADVVARLCTFRGALPQGAPTSNALLDAVLATFDLDVVGFASRRSVEYTRYVDDVALSGPSSVDAVVEYVISRARAQGFAVNPDKTARGGGDVPIDITGVRLVSGRMTATPKAVAAAEAALAAFAADPSEGNRAGAEGQLNWVGRIDPRAARAVRAGRGLGAMSK